MIRNVTVLAVLFGWTVVAPDQVAAQTGAPLRRARVQTAKGDAPAGVVTELENGNLTLVGEQTWKYAQRDVVRLDFFDRSPKLRGNVPLLMLANGDLLAASVVDGDQERLTARWSQLSALRDFPIPLEAIRACVLRRPAGEEAGRLLWKRLADYKAEQDELVLENGDSLKGELTKIGSDALQLDGEGGAGRVERTAVVAVAFNASLAELEPLDGPGALVTLIDGSRFRASEMRLVQGELLSFKTLFDVEFVMPAATVCSLQFLGGSADLLSDLEPSHAEFTPYLSIEWPWRRDRNCLAQPLRMRGTEYASGLGVHSRQSLKYSLGGKYREFRATVGIDDSAKGKGSVLFQVKLDGRPVWKSEVVRGSDDVIEIEGVDLKGGNELELLVDFGPQGDVLDHADWCDAVLVKSR